MQGANGTEQRRLCGMYMLYFCRLYGLFRSCALYLTQYGFNRQALGVISSAQQRRCPCVILWSLADHVLSPKKMCASRQPDLRPPWGLLLLPH